MRIAVDPDAATPPYEQVRAQLEALIRSGELAGGERIPPVRQLASDLGVAPNTVHAAYRALEAAGLLIAGRGAAGTTITPGNVADADLVAAADALVTATRTAGLGFDQGVAVFRAAWRPRGDSRL
jgi:DNA-binding transcriptional regulator YhcF (GntR family)